MGVYIYSLRSPKLTKKIRLEDGSVTTVGVYAFEYKPLSSMWGPEPRWQTLARARIVRLNNIWDKYIKEGNSWPKAGVMVHTDSKEITVGCSVFSWSYGSLPVCFEDCTMGGAKFLGKVSEVLE